ncbi:MAG: tetratricopeptide repeat protein [Deltaproteobacteria bacterium]|nr:tetratricopeptide repeat protein [Deltaproteobacteria bacterium]
MFFKRTISYNRAISIETAGEARTKGKLKLAIAEYKKILAADPADQAVLMKIAPLLAQAKNYPEAWKSFKAAAERYEKGGFFNKAVGVYTHASRCMPKETSVWEALCSLYLTQGLKADAAGVLMKGHLNFLGRKHRDKAVKLLKGAFDIQPWFFEPTYALAGLLSKTGRKKEALDLLDGLAERKTAEKRRKALWAAFRISPGPGRAWRWVKAAVKG